MQKSTKSSDDKQVYEKALRCVAEATRKTRRPGFLNGILAAGVIAYKDSRKSKEPPAEIARQAVGKLPKHVKDGLTTEDENIIRDAIAGVLSET